MAEVIMKFVDRDDGQVDVTIEGDPPLEDLDKPGDGSMAQLIAVWAFQAVQTQIEKAAIVEAADESGSATDGDGT